MTNGKERREGRSTRPERVPVLNIGGLRLQNQTAPIGVDYDLALAALHLVASVVAAWTAALGRVQTLAVEHDGGRRRVASDPLPVGHDKHMVDLSNKPRLARTTELLFGGKSLGSSRHEIPPRRT